MEVRRLPRHKLFLSALLLGTVAGVALTLIQFRQNRLDTVLLAAIRRDNTAVALEMLNDGADPNAEAWIGAPNSPETLVVDIGFWLRHQRRPEKGFRAPALYLVLTGPFRLNPERRAGGRFPRYAIPGARNFSRQENVPLVKALLDRGADPNRHPGRTSPLHLAVRLDYRDTVRLLLERHADPNVLDDSHFTPLMAASPACAALLIQHGADVNAKGYQGLTPLMVAAADPGVSGEARLTTLLEHGANVNARDVYGQTPLMHAATIRAAWLLLEHGADINARTPSGVTALMMDCANYSQPELPRFLVEQGAQLSIKDRAGKSAIDYASDRQRVGLCRFLADATARESRAGQINRHGPAGTETRLPDPR